MTKHNIYLFQPQYAVEIRQETNYWVPYSVGCLWSYASQFSDITDHFNLADIIFRRDPPDEILDRMHDPVYCGFSVYIWNFQYCLTLAEMIKTRWPACVIQFGGPETSGKLLKHDFVDSIVAGEGEEKFVESLRAIKNNTPVPLLSQKQRLQQLDIPSPYTTGVFDHIIKNNPNVLWSMTLETNRGCPYACTFCDWGGVTYSKIKKFNLDHVQADLEWATVNPVGFVFLADANFGIFKERDLTIAQMIRSAADRSKIDSINIQYAKNSTEVVFEIAKIVGPYSRGVTFSVQSMNPSTLEAINRKNLDVNDIAELMKLSDQHNVNTYTEVILGLPLETVETWKQGLADILEMGQHQAIDIWFTQLLENSELSQPESRQKYGIKTVRASDYSPLYNKSDYRGIDEKIELVSATNTMPTEDLVEAYLYAWMIINLHIAGYTQYAAKYVRYKKNVSYRQFYDAMFEKLQNTEPFKTYVSQYKNVIQQYLTTGKIIDFDNHTRGGHGLHSVGGQMIYQNRTSVFDITEEILLNQVGPDLSILKLQRCAMLDTTQTYPITVKLNFDIHTWQDSPCEYIVHSSISPDSNFDFYLNRRKGLLKNQITKA
jgi:putative methyltransferase